MVVVVERGWRRGLVVIPGRIAEKYGSMRWGLVATVKPRIDRSPEEKRRKGRGKDRGGKGREISSRLAGAATAVIMVVLVAMGDQIVRMRR